MAASSPFVRGHRAAGLSYALIELHAQLRRQALGFGRLGPIDPRKLLNRIEQEFSLKSRQYGVRYRVDVGVVTPQTIDGAEAITRYNRHEICFEVLLAEGTYTGVLNGEPHFLFTLAHELGHLFLHHDWMLAQTAYELAALHPKPQSTPTHDIYEDTEWQADAFAAAFLMPAAYIADMEISSARTLSNLCNTSMAAATNRLNIYLDHSEELLAVSQIAQGYSRRVGLERATSQSR